jgi:hypothetical protein
MDIMPSNSYSNQEEVTDLDLLAQVIFDHISSNLSRRMERNGFHRSTHVFSRGMAEPRRTSPVQLGSSSPLTETEKPDALAQLSREIEHLLHHRLILEQERCGRSLGRLPW